MTIYALARPILQGRKTNDKKISKFFIILFEYKQTLNALYKSYNQITDQNYKVRRLIHDL